MNAVMAERRISVSVVDDYISAWRRARLSKGSALGWPANSIFGRLVEMGPFGAAIGRAFGSRMPFRDSFTVWDRDVLAVQKIVNLMPPEIRGPFEAFHIGVIRGESCRGRPHKARALTLGLERQTYYDRVDMGKRYIQERIGEIIDNSDTSE